MSRPAVDYKFGPLVVRVRGLGVYFADEHLRASCDKLSADELQAANREAWKQRRTAARRANAVSNISAHGWNAFDRATQHLDVAEVVCKETWKRMQREAA